MKAIMVSIFDITTSTFRQPFYAMNEADAKRAFRMILESNDLMKRNPSDFELYHVGMWDDEVGIFDINTSGETTNETFNYRLFRGGEVIHEQGIGQNSI